MSGRNKIAFAFADDEEGTRGKADYSFRGAAKYFTAQALAAVSGDNDEIDAEFASGGSDFEVRHAFAKFGYGLDSLRNCFSECLQFVAVVVDGLKVVGIHLWDDRVWFDNVEEHQFGAELPGERDGVLECFLGASGKIHWDKNLF